VKPFRTFLAGGHIQTIGGVIVRAFSRWPDASEDVIVDAGDGVQLLLRASWQPGAPRSERPALLLVHGLEGSDRAPYVVSTGRLAFRFGWHVIRMNMRGCGDSLDLCPRLYNAGLASDLVAVLSWLASRVDRFALTGFSLGAGLTLMTLAQEKDRLPDRLAGAVAICPPLDMSAAADALELRGNWIYQRRFTRSLCASYRNRQRRDPERYEAGRERGVKTLREFDDVITAHYDGYRDAEDYYARVSAGPMLTRIDRPTLVLSTDDDPFIPLRSVDHWPCAPVVQREISHGAGHVGFVGASEAPRLFWAAERALSFLRQTVPGWR